MDKVEFEKIVDEVLKEAKNGEVKANTFTYNIQFNSTLNPIEDPDLLFLRIRDKNNFTDLLYEYVVKHFEYRKNDFNFESIKECITLLFGNLTYSDLESPEAFITKYMSFYDSPVIREKIIYENCLLNSDLYIENVLHKKTYETPYCFISKFKSKIDDEEVDYKLPIISYGIENDTCYIYTVQGYKKEDLSLNQEKYHKKINRSLYKLNDKITESKEYEEYKNNTSEYYPENISDVSMPFILALTIFLKELELINCNKIKIVPLLPVRYNSKKISNDKKISYYSMKNNMSEEEIQILKDKYESEHLRIQSNVTEKFIRCFYRLAYHFNNIDIKSTPYIEDEYMNIQLSSFQSSNNEILNNIIEEMNKKNSGELKK